MSLQENLKLSPDELRSHILSYWKAHPQGHYATMGVLLTRIKEEGLAQSWGYPKYSHYLIKELDIVPPVIANIWTGIVNKLRVFFNFSITEMEILEKKVPQQLMAVSLRYAETRQELESIWQRANYKSISWTGLDKQKFTEREVRKAAWDKLFFNDQEAVLLENLANFLRIKYKLPTGGEKRSRVVMVLALVYKGLIERGEEDMESWLRRELKRFNLPTDIADIKSAVFKIPKQEDEVERLAKELVNRKMMSDLGGYPKAQSDDDRHSPLRRCCGTSPILTRDNGGYPGAVRYECSQCHATTDPCYSTVGGADLMAAEEWNNQPTGHSE